ncbi:MAG: hypothetical protein LBI48_02105 [Burkholderiaceae bacterium]|jgi:hypothetical protein|nr:hypothetical protein [Burkholderiaceae bacterium]
MTHETQDERLERQIALRSNDVLRLQGYAEHCADEFFMKAVLRSLQRHAAADVAALVALRSPQTVARMEAERNLA